MKGFVKKLIGKLENRIKYNELCQKKFSNAKMSFTYKVQINTYKNVIKIVNQLAEEYNNGWIPCSDRLPSKEEYLKDDGKFIVTDGNRVYQSLFDIYSGIFVKDYFGSAPIEDNCVIAWQPLPAFYQKGE